MPHRVDSADRSGSMSHRPEDRGPYDHPNTHPSPPPIAAIHNSPAPSQASEQVASPSPPVPQQAYYQGPPPPNGPPMHQAYPYPPHARYPADPAVQMPPGYPPSSHYAPPVGHVSTRSIQPIHVSSQPVFEQPSYIVHTDDAATKLNDRVRRKCYNCRTTDTSTWRRSSLTPGKVLCNKCGLFERTHSRPRPEQFPHKRGPIVTSTFKSSRSPPPPSRLPPMQHHMPPLPPHHYDHPSIAPLMPPRADGHPHYAPPPPPPGAGGSPNPNAIGNLLNSPHAGGAPSSHGALGHAGAVGAHGSPVPAHASAGSASASSGAVAHAENGDAQGNGANGAGNSLKRPRSPSTDRSPRQEQRSPPYAHRAPASTTSAA
ncbi:uncharacterized protein PHACADRAFT_166850 [Phanerochaete carnosa HHB-10118-sp]|uniref:GATA-type domain-containing protein n=1 Tax=Phanerochaete carnosa (strain HHB-10118-sp) TaxID=650164 RepID=K5VGN0_PHACS|nr:uncharacterized protein PHACADRAFT_166850 [Phanerochaete carnosa HHB-10118-sp]EKM50348.1 hypothetical protein PHACADRAFT_166850 [Phanerochaete carnosa HHB-10118-sp]